MRAPSRQLPLPLPHRPRLADWPFIEAPSNAAALALLRRPGDWPDRRLVLHGEPGSGKSHLLQRWAAARAGSVVEGAALRFPGGGEAAALAIDEADRAAEEALLHVLNTRAEAGRITLLAAREAPCRWNIQLPDLASRLRASLVAELGPPGDALLAALFAWLLADRQLLVPAPIQHWLLLRLPRDPAALREAAARLDRATLAAGTGVTRPLAAAVVDEMERMWQPVVS
jgi:chromosomal replication initiation ATPase DnaA